MNLFYNVIQKQRLISEYQTGNLEYHPESPLSQYYDWNDYF